MDITVANRVEKVKPSPTLAINAKAKQLAAKGGDIISLSVGEPDFDTPQPVKDAAIKAIQDGYSKYTPVDGLPSLKNGIVNKFQVENELTYTPDQILVSCGAKHSLYNLFQALLNPGDEVIIPAPYWVSYPDMVLLSEATPVIVSAGIEQEFKITAEQLDNAINERTKMVILNSPSNPTGMVYSKNELAEIGEVLLKHPQVLIVSDDIYEHIIWTHRPFFNIINACPELYERTIVINGVSKAYAMTGWRIGYAAGHKKIIATMKKIQSQSTSNPCAVAQMAAQAALELDPQHVQDMVKEFKSRHDFVVQALKGIPGVKCLNSSGTFYTFPDFSEIINSMPGIESDLDFCEHLLAKAGVAAVPGSAFGAQGCIRISYAASVERLNDALKRMKTVIQR